MKRRGLLRLASALVPAIWMTGGVAAGAPWQSAAPASAAAQASPELVGALSKEMGATPEQAAGAAGTLFGVAKSRLSAAEFSQVAKAVPGMDALLKAAPGSSAPGGEPAFAAVGFGRRPRNRGDLVLEARAQPGHGCESGADPDVGRDEIRRRKRRQSARRGAEMTAAGPPSPISLCRHREWPALAPPMEAGFVRRETLSE
jgi:hypothetical protein